MESNAAVLNLNFKVITLPLLILGAMLFISKVVSYVSLLELCVAKSLDDGAVSPPIPTPTKYILLEKLNGLNQD